MFMKYVFGINIKSNYADFILVPINMINLTLCEAQIELQWTAQHTKNGYMM